ncbi:head decoration protein [Paenochrobactrum sp. BZR 588]|uniref:head decoration protein n=1 Tax=unclassified Paenochrobactrum TaxID=2639760 RepID=UPI0038551E76
MNTQDYNPGDLLVGDYPVAVRTVKIAQGQVLKRGAVVGDTGTAFVLSEAASADGSETPAGVLAIDVDATAGAIATRIYASGGFDASKLILGDGHTIDTVETAWRKSQAPLFIHRLA